jgi:hypothetical protein
MNRPRMMTRDELATIEHRVALYWRGDPGALEALLEVADPDGEPVPQWLLDLSEMLEDADAARKQIEHLTAELRIAAGRAS